MGFWSGVKNIGGTLVGAATGGLVGAGIGGAVDLKRASNRRSDIRAQEQNAAEMKELEELGLKPRGYPEYEEPAFQSNIPELDRRLGGMQGLSAFRQEALRTGPSAWADLAKRRLGTEQEDARQSLVQSSAGQTGTAMSRLAMGGGLTAGARERLASQGAQNTFAQSQALNRDFGQQRLGVDIADEQNRLNMLGQLPGLEYQTQISPWLALANRENEQLEDRSRARNEFNLGRFNTQMGAYGALKTAQAQRRR